MGVRVADMAKGEDRVVSTACCNILAIVLVYDHVFAASALNPSICRICSHHKDQDQVDLTWVTLLRPNHCQQNARHLK